MCLAQILFTKTTLPDRFFWVTIILWSALLYFSLPSAFISFPAISPLALAGCTSCQPIWPSLSGTCYILTLRLEGMVWWALFRIYFISPPMVYAVSFFSGYGNGTEK